MYRKGTILLRKRILNPRNGKTKLIIIPLHEDMTNPEFFERHSEVLSMESGKEYTWQQGTVYPDFVMSQLNIPYGNSNADGICDDIKV